MLKNIHIVVIGVALFVGFNLVFNTLTAIIAAFVLSFSWIALNVFSLKYSLFLKSTCRIKTHEKVVFLTFDDGPSEQYTPFILNTLKAKNTHALFFCIGQNAELYPELVQRISKEGHLIGNHTYSHKWQNTVKLPRIIAAEISHTTDIICKITGHKTELFRPPFGVTNPSIAKAVKTLGMHCIGWDIRSFDTIIKDPEKLIDRICKRLRPGSIILLHDNREVTSLILDELIENIQNRGFKILPLPVIK